MKKLTVVLIALFALVSGVSWGAGTTRTTGGGHIERSTASITNNLQAGGLISTPIIPVSTQSILSKTSFGPFSDDSTHALLGITDASGHLFISDSGGVTQIPFYSSGGSGVSYRHTILDPDTGWLINTTAADFSFAVSGGNTYRITLIWNTAVVNVARTAGTSSYSAAWYSHSN